MNVHVLLEKELYKKAIQGILISFKHTFNLDYAVIAAIHCVQFVTS